MLGLGNDFLNDDVDKGPSDYWECRRQLLLLHRTHTKFEYLFRLLEFGVGFFVFVYSMLLTYAEWDMSGDLDWFPLIFMVAGLVLMVYVRLRKPPEFPELIQTAELRSSKSED